MGPKRAGAAPTAAAELMIIRASTARLHAHFRTYGAAYRLVVQAAAKETLDEGTDRFQWLLR
jgi:hypothetical protein